MAWLLLKNTLVISAIFNDTQYHTLRAVMDAAVARHTALASNVANVNTPGYQRRDISATFEQELQRAVQTGDPNQIRTVLPKIEVDQLTPSLRMDGNNVNLEREMVEIAKNSAQYEVSSALLSKKYQGLRMAISGKA
jgi:flagellar basal-body rod protein FlgB